MKLSSDRTTSVTTDARPSSSTTSVSSTASSSVRQSSSSLAQLLRGVLQTVKTRRKRGEREKFLRALEKSGVDFAHALLLTDDDNARPSRSLASDRSSTRSNLSSISSSSSATVSTNRTLSTRHCMRSLDRIEKLQVRATVESAHAGGTLVTLQLLLITSPPREITSTQIPLQQPQLQTQELSRGAAGVVVYQGLGAIRQQRVHELTRSFDDFRKLRKMIAFCVRRGREDDDGEHHHHHHNTQSDESASPLQCSYCREVRVFVAQCWEQPPLLETSMLSNNCAIRKGVLASSVLHFVRLAKSEPLFPPRHAVHNNRGALGSGAATAANGTSGTTTSTGINGASNTNQHGAPLSSPKCQAHAEIATILHDFFRLQLIIAQ